MKRQIYALESAVLTADLGLVLGLWFALIETGIPVIYESALELREVGRKACKKFDTVRHLLGCVNYAIEF
jgi:hypothetical protein